MSSSIPNVSRSDNIPNPNSSNPPLTEGGVFQPLRYGAYAERKQFLESKQPKDVYFPPCEAATVRQQISDFFKKYTMGTFLEVYDKHLNHTGRDDAYFWDRRVAEVRAGVNLVGKMVLGTALIVAVVGTIAGGIAGGALGIAGCLATAGDLDPAAGAYVGALVGCAIAGGVATCGALIGSSLIALTEPGMTLGGRAKIVGLGTGAAFIISFYIASPIIQLGKQVSEIEYLKEGNVDGFLFLHCFGLPT